jgi:putative polyhydroxyalkanoate system protein
MPAIDIKRSHSLGMDTAKERAEQLAKDLEGKLGINWRWEGNDIRFKADSGAAKGVTGKVAVSSSDVRVEIDLPFLLKAMKRSIRGKVEDRLDRLVG